MDWLVTGDALHSLHGTAALAETVDRRRDPLTGPYWTAQYLGYTLREPLVIGIPIGLAFAWRQRLRGAILPLAVAAAMLAVFLASPFFGLPLIGRYVRTPAVLLALFYGLAVFGWRMLPPGDERRRWLVAGVLAAALSVAFLPWHVKMLSSLDERLVYQGAYYRDLREVGRAPAVRAALARCGPIATADHRPIPHLRWWLEGTRAPSPPSPTAPPCAARSCRCSRAGRARCGASIARTSRPPSARPDRGCSTATPPGGCSRRRAAVRASRWRARPRSDWRGRSRRWPSSRAIACSRSAAGTAWRPRWCASA